MYAIDKIYTIYAIRCKSNSRLYIGITSNLNERIQVHFQSLKSGKHSNQLMLEDYGKYGKEDFEIYVLEENIPYREKKKEYEYMRKYNSFDEKYGYNRGDRKSKNIKTFDYIRTLPPNLYENDLIAKTNEEVGG